MALTGLEGVSKEITECICISKSYIINSVLRRGLAATAAGDNGALNVYRDDEGKIRCESFRHMVTMDKQIFTTLKDAKTWADEWLKIIHNE